MSEPAPTELNPFAGGSRSSWAVRRYWRARLLPTWRDLRGPLAIALALAVVVMGTIGYADASTPLYVAIYKSFHLFLFTEAGVQEDQSTLVNVAAILGPLLVGVAAIKGLLILSRDQLRLVGFRLFRRGHIVVAGLGDVGFRLASELSELGGRVIAIDRDAASPSIEGCRQRGVSVLIGDATDPDVLRTACAHRARHLIAAPGVDAVAIDVLAAAGEVARGRDGSPLLAFAHIEDRILWQALEARTLTRGQLPELTVELFNVYEVAGRLALERHPPFAEPETADRNGPAMLVVGDGPMAEILAVNAARLWRHARERERARLEITIAGADAETQCARMAEHFPMLAEAAELRPWTLDIGAPELHQAARARDAGAIYVALEDEARGVAAALLLAATNKAARSVVLMLNDERLGAASLASEDARIGAIDVFGVLNTALDPNFLLRGLTETLARAMHASYLREQRTSGAEALPNLVPWDELSEDARAANRAFAADIPAKLAAAGCVVVPTPLVDVERSRRVFAARLDGSLESLAAAEHARWCAERVAAGWSHGPERDDASRIHPSIVPYGELSESEREKDRAAIRELPVMLAAHGFAIEPLAVDPGPGGA